MEIHTSGACWSVGPTTVQGHSGGRGLVYQPCMHTSMWVCAATCVRAYGRRGRTVGGGGVDGIAVPAGQLKYSAEVSIATAWDTRKPWLPVQ